MRSSGDKRIFKAFRIGFRLRFLGPDSAQPQGEELGVQPAALALHAVHQLLGLRLPNASFAWLSARNRARNTYFEAVSGSRPPVSAAFSPVAVMFRKTLLR